MAKFGKFVLINVLMMLTFFHANVLSEEVCNSESNTIYYCNDGFSCCDGDEKCCTVMNTWVILAIASGGVIFVAIVITVVCVIVKKTTKTKVRVVQARPAIQTTRAHYASHPVDGGMIIPGQVMPPPPMYDPVGPGSSSYGYDPGYEMDAEFKRFGKMKQKDKLGKSNKKGGPLGPDMSHAPPPMMGTGRLMNGRMGMAVGPMPMPPMMEPPPYRSPTPSLSPTPEPPEIHMSTNPAHPEPDVQREDTGSTEFEHPPPS